MPFLIGIGPPELLIVLAIAVVLFGTAKIAGIGSAMSRSIREFRRELKAPEEEEEKKEATKSEQAASETEPPGGTPYKH